MIVHSHYCINCVYPEFIFLDYDLFIYCFRIILIGSCFFVCLLPAWQGKSGTDSAVRDGDKYNASNSVWNSSTHRHQWVICICNPNHISNQWSLTGANCWWPYSKHAIILPLQVINILQVFSIPQLKCLLLLQRFKMTMRAIQGALIISSCIQIILGYSQLWGVCSRYRQGSPSSNWCFIDTIVKILPCLCHLVFLNFYVQMNVKLRVWATFGMTCVDNMGTWSIMRLYPISSLC